MAKKGIRSTIKFFDTKTGINKASSLSSFQIAKLISGQSKALAPTDDGLLRNSIMAISDKGQDSGLNNNSGEKSNLSLKDQPKKGSAHVGTALDYGIYQEFGTRRMRAQPYLRPSAAIITGQSKTFDFVSQIFDKEVKKSTKKVIRTVSSSK